MASGGGGRSLGPPLSAVSSSAIPYTPYAGAGLGGGGGGGGSSGGLGDATGARRPHSSYHRSGVAVPGSSGYRDRDDEVRARADHDLHPSSAAYMRQQHYEGPSGGATYYSLNASKPRVPPSDQYSRPHSPAISRRYDPDLAGPLSPTRAMSPSFRSLRDTFSPDMPAGPMHPTSPATAQRSFGSDGRPISPYFRRGDPAGDPNPYTAYRQEKSRDAYRRGSETSSVGGYAPPSARITSPRGSQGESLVSSYGRGGAYRDDGHDRGVGGAIPPMMSSRESRSTASDHYGISGAAPHRRYISDELANSAMSDRPFSDDGRPDDALSTTSSRYAPSERTTRTAGPMSAYDGDALRTIEYHQSSVSQKYGGRPPSQPRSNSGYESMASGFGREEPPRSARYPSSRDGDWDDERPRRENYVPHRSEYRQSQAIMEESSGYFSDAGASHRSYNRSRDTSAVSSVVNGYAYPSSRPSRIADEGPIYPSEGHSRSTTDSHPGPHPLFSQERTVPSSSAVHDQQSSSYKASLSGGPQRSTSASSSASDVRRPLNSGAHSTLPTAFSQNSKMIQSILKKSETSQSSPNSQRERDELPLQSNSKSQHGLSQMTPTREKPSVSVPDGGILSPQSASTPRPRTDDHPSESDFGPKQAAVTRSSILDGEIPFSASKTALVGSDSLFNVSASGSVGDAATPPLPPFTPTSVAEQLPNGSSGSTASDALDANKPANGSSSRSGPPSAAPSLRRTSGFQRQPLGLGSGGAAASTDSLTNEIDAISNRVDELKRGMGSTRDSVQVLSTSLGDIAGKTAGGESVGQSGSARASVGNGSEPQSDARRATKRRSVLDSMSVLTRNLKHSLSLSQDVNKMLASAGEDGLSASKTSVARSLSDMQVSSLTVLVRMMEQLEAESALPGRQS
ncbi:hypothetical protein DFJ73DRAFT_368954 [Zopfochytrium polystomum]|nr:hypothetical protein DFJ73DRAFT_368954 [Zopfochytrium polystomum]